MALDVLRDCELVGPALPEPFVRLELETWLTRQGLLVRTTGSDGRALQESWTVYRRKLRELGTTSGPVRVRNQVLEPLVERLGYARVESAPAVPTREEPQRGETGGHLLISEDEHSRLRVWSTEYAADLDAPARRGAAYRYSHVRVAQRVLLASGERVGLLTNGVQLRILLSDPARPDSQVLIPLDPNWRRSRQVPDSYRLLLALCGPKGIAALPKLVDEARLKQARVTKDLRIQARQAVERFIQEVLDHPENQANLDGVDRERLARELWHEGLILVYRLLFILKLESSDDPARAFSFASTSLWRNTFSPTVALAPLARKVLDCGAETGSLLEEGVRSLCRLFRDGVESTEFHVKPLGGALFGDAATPWLSDLVWGERAIAMLLDRLLWTDPRRVGEARRRVYYGPLDVEDLGRVYEALLELEPGIATSPMCRLRRQKLEVVVPLAQGERYRQSVAGEAADAGDEEEEPEEDTGGRNVRTRVEWVEEIQPGGFYLRVGLGRKASGSYYTPHSFVRFLVQETLGPQVLERSPHDEPHPAEILKLKVLDPAMGSGHFLVEACRFLGERLYEAVRFCDVKALEAETRAARSKDEPERRVAEGEAAAWRERIVALPDPDDKLLAYLPSRAPEGEESGFSQARALAICKRLVAVHCLYGVDKNPLAVELAKLSLWLETQAEGFPLTFLDHRLVVGDSLTGPFWEHLIKLPGSQRTIEGLYDRDLLPKFTEALREAIRYVGHLEARVGATVAEIEDKARLKREMDRALAPFRVLAAAWAGGVMLGVTRSDDASYEELVRSIGHTGELPECLPEGELLRPMLAQGLGVAGEQISPNRDAVYALLDDGSCIPALPYDLVFPEVFYPTGVPWGRRGFHAVLGNPPWDAIQFKTKEFLAAFDLAILDAPTSRERDAIERRLISAPGTGLLFDAYQEGFEQVKRACDKLFAFQKVQVEGDLAGRQLDQFRVFAERNYQLLQRGGYTGVVLPSAFHANEGATGIRRLYLEKMHLHFCFSFENRRKLFEIDSRFKFAVVVASRDDNGTDEFQCAFYIHDEEWLYSKSPERLRYSIGFVRQTGGEYLTLLELRTNCDSDAAQRCAERSQSFGAIYSRLRITWGRDLDLTDDSRQHFRPISDLIPGDGDPRDPVCQDSILQSGFLPMHEGKTFHQYADRWGGRPRYAISVASLSQFQNFARCPSFFRAAIREIARGTDERTAISAVLPPGVVCSKKIYCERKQWARPNSAALMVVGLMDSFTFDFNLRLRVQSSVSLFILDACPVPESLNSGRVASSIAHWVVRLTCNHSGYEPLWREQITAPGGDWREPKSPYTWPVLETADKRWDVRAAIDAVVADAYGLTREHYQHVLATFSHRSYPNAPALCLAKFDELRRIGIDAFTREYDPYWDVPLNEALPQPVIDLPGLNGADVAASDGRPVNLLGEPLPVNLFGEVDTSVPKRRRRR